MVSESGMTTSPTVAVERGFMQAANRLPTLFSLEAEAYDLLAILEDGNLDFLQESEVKAELALIDQMLMTKTESYVSVIRSLESMADARKAEADRLNARAKTAQRHADFLRQRLLDHMQTTVRPRIETARFTLTFRLNNPSVNVINAADIPSEFTRTTITVAPDKGAILTHTKATGEVVPGTLIERTPRLEIK